MTTDPKPEPTLAELELREQLCNAMDGNLRMSAHGPSERFL